MIPPKRKAKGKKKAGPKVDKQTLALLHDLSVATIAYTRGSMADESLPTQAMMDEAQATAHRGTKTSCQGRR